MTIEVKSEEEMKQIGARLGALLHGGETIELIGDVGAGKTTFTKGIAVGLDVDEDVQSPSFTISRVYDGRQSLRLFHYDFYRLQEAGIMHNEIAETLQNPRAVTLIEWAGVVKGVLPADRLSISIQSPTEHSRRLTMTASGQVSHRLLGAIA